MYSFVSKKRLDPISKSVDTNKNDKYTFKSQMFIIPNQSDLDQMESFNKSSILS
jgi:hypothetical protein